MSSSNPDFFTRDSEPFCRVEHREGGRSRYYVVHDQAPRLVVEIESEQDSGNGRRVAVLRRVAVPNSWSGDYHRSGHLLGAALKYFERTHEILDARRA